MLKALVAFAFGYYAGEHSAVEPAPRERGSASGWLAAFLILIGLLVWGHAELRPHVRPDAHNAVMHKGAMR